MSISGGGWFIVAVIVGWLFYLLVRWAERRARNSRTYAPDQEVLYAILCIIGGVLLAVAAAVLCALRVTWRVW